MKELTKAEEQVMQILWKLGKGFVKDIIEQLGDPKPAYNTVSTIVRILEKKGFVSHQAFGNTHQYFPIVDRNEYKKGFMKNFIKNYFGDSFRQMVSFLAEHENLSITELEEIKKMMDEQIEEQKNAGK